MYKLKISHNGKFVMARYFDSKNKAADIRDEYNRNFKCDGYEAKLQAKKVNVSYHHCALEKGYISKHGGRDDYYDGKFGVGFKRHISNVVSRCPNTFHVVEYYIET